MDIKINNEPNKISSGYTKNKDIEEVLSETFSFGSGTSGKDRSGAVSCPRNEGCSGDILINKIGNVNSPQNNTNQKILDKVERSSNKDVDIGLDLLVNKDKRNVRSDTSNLKNAFDFGNTSPKIKIKQPTNVNKIEVKSMDKLDEIMDNLNIDTSSRLSQKEIDRLIDNKDTEKFHTPNLFTEEDVVNAINEEIDDKKSIDVSNKFKPQPRNNYNQSNFHQTSRLHQNFQPMDMETIRRRKQEILFKLEKMRRLGVQGIRKFNMSSDLNNMEDELTRVKYEREVESSIKFQRKCLMACVTGAELLNNKFDFLDFKLDGWSEQVNENIDEYNEVFEELHEKYKERARMAPEIKLIFMLGGSAFMYHLTNSMFKNSIPGMEDIMRQNPQLMKQFADAAINQMQGEPQQAAQMFSNFMPGMQAPQRGRMPGGMSGGMNYNNRPPPQPMNSNMNYSQMQTPAPRYNAPTRTVPITPARNIHKRNNPKQSMLKPPAKILPPSGVDEILNELRSNTEDLSEVLSQSSQPRNATAKHKLRKRTSKKLNLTMK